MKLAASFLLLSVTFLVAEDPSLKPYLDPSGSGKYLERYRIVVDLDEDGADDLLLSSGLGRPLWTVYLWRNKTFKAIGTLHAHPKAIAFEADHDRISIDIETRRFARIWVYLRGAGSEGALGYYRVSNDSVDDLKSIEIYPGDGGTDLGRAIYNATFQHSPIPFKIQQSSTGVDGSVSWAAIER